MAGEQPEAMAPGQGGDVAGLGAGQCFGMKLGDHGGARVFLDSRFDHAGEVARRRQSAGNRFIASRLIHHQHDGRPNRDVGQHILVRAVVVLRQAMRREGRHDLFGRCDLRRVEHARLQQRLEVAWLPRVVVDAGAVHDHGQRALRCSGLEGAEKTILERDVWKTVTTGEATGTSGRGFVPPARNGPAGRWRQQAELRNKAGHGAYFGCQPHQSPRINRDTAVHAAGIGSATGRVTTPVSWRGAAPRGSGRRQRRACR